MLNYLDHNEKLENGDLSYAVKLYVGHVDLKKWKKKIPLICENLRLESGTKQMFFDMDFVR